MRKIYGLVKNQEGSWRIRRNEEIDLLGKHADVVGCMQEQRIRWIVHIVRMDKERMVERISITEWRRTAIRKIGRPRFICQDVGRDVGKMKIQNCSKMVVDGEEW
jgi:hypothetical protein